MLTRHGASPEIFAIQCGCGGTTRTPAAPLESIPQNFWRQYQVSSGIRRCRGSVSTGIRVEVHSDCVSADVGRHFGPSDVPRAGRRGSTGNLTVRTPGESRDASPDRGDSRKGFIATAATRLLNCNGQPVNGLCPRLHASAAVRLFDQRGGDWPFYRSEVGSPCSTSVVVSHSGQCPRSGLVTTSWFRDRPARRDGSH